MEVLYAIVGPVVESLMVPIKRHLGYLISSTKYVNDMGNKMKQLDGTSIDVKKRIESNNINNREIPTRVPGWLDEVERIKNDVESISRNRIGCFNMKTRYQTARKATNIIMEIESLTKENHDIAWTDIPKPPGRVYSNKVSTSASSSGGDAHSDFKSRDEIFKEALEFLKQDHKSIQVLAICGMGGVGKTTMMEQLKEVVVDQKLFKWVVKVVIGQKPNMLLIQKAIAEHVGQPLTEETLTIRADILRKKYGHMLDGGKILVILDDVWEKIELKDIGLSPFPNGCKLILTSREENVCTQTAVEACCDLKVLKVLVLKEEEAQNFFSQITGVSKEDDPQLHQIGCDIVRKCGYLPLAIKLIATTLKFQKEPVWRNTRKRLKNNVLVKNVEEIIKISYDHLREEEDKAIFLLCGLFPDDFNIPIEDLARYAWGLKLWKEFDTFGDARDQIDRCVSNLKSANMLMDSDHDGCVKMHDLVLAFVLGSVSKGHHPWIINHGDATKMSGTEIMSKSCKRVSLTCTGMSEFPIDFGFPKLSLLKLMQGDKSLMFPEDFYAKMEELEVVAYEKMQYPLLPRSPQCSINLRTFCLHDCSLMFDLSPIGDLISLEVLSFAYCHIRRLPSTIGNLKKLKLLDLTRCVDLHIDEGVLKGLTKLEELYMRGLKEYVNYDELAEVSKNLFAFEFEFSNNNAFGKKISFKKLERFRISMGRLLGNVYEKIIQYSFENTLKLVTNRSELVESGVNELFMKTEVLHLEVNDMNDFEDVLAESRHPHQDCFNNLRVLDVFKCANLKYLFEVSIPNGLKKLEYLTISSCPVLKALVYLENTRAGTIDFPKLKSLSLDELPELVGLCNIVNVIELPELVKLELDGLPKFNSVYSDYEGTTCSSSNGILSILNKKVDVFMFI